MPRVGHHQRRRHPGPAQDLGRIERILVGRLRALLAPAHRRVEIVLQRLGHHLGQASVGVVEPAAADQDRQPEAALLPRRFGQPFERDRSDRVLAARNIAMPEFGGEDDDRRGRRRGRQGGDQSGQPVGRAQQQVGGQRGRRQIEAAHCCRRQDQARSPPSPGEEHPDHRQQDEQVRRDQRGIGNPLQHGRSPGGDDRLAAQAVVELGCLPLQAKSEAAPGARVGGGDAPAFPPPRQP